MDDLTPQQKEVLLITAEECSEVIKEISKIFRFGIDTEWNGVVNRNHLAEELGDLMCMVELCISTNIVSEKSVHNALIAKTLKLKQWSNICINN